MSGCSVCVYDLYGDALEEYRERIQLARKRIATFSPAVTRDEWPADQLGLFPADQAQRDAEERAKEAALTPEERERLSLDQAIDARYPVDQVLDPVMAAFLNLERNIKHKQAETHPDLVKQELEEMTTRSTKEHKDIQNQLAREEAEVEKRAERGTAP